MTLPAPFTLDAMNEQLRADVLVRPAEAADFCARLLGAQQALLAHLAAAPTGLPGNYIVPGCIPDWTGSWFRQAAQYSFSNGYKGEGSLVLWLSVRIGDSTYASRIIPCHAPRTEMIAYLQSDRFLLDSLQSFHDLAYSAWRHEDDHF